MMVPRTSTGSGGGSGGGPPSPLLLLLLLLRQRLPSLPRGLDGGRGADEVLLRHAVPDALEHLLDGGDVVGVDLVVAEAEEAPPLLVVLVALDDGVVERAVHGFQLLPLLRGDVHGAEGAVVARVVEDEEVEDGDGVVIRIRFVDALGLVVRVGFEEGELEAHAEVDGVLLRGLPLEDVLVGADLVGGAAAGEDEAVVAVDLLDLGDDLAEHHLDAVAELGRLVLDGEDAVLLLLGELVVHGVVGLQDLLLEVGQALVERAVHQALPVQHHAVEDEVLELRRAVLVRVVDELAVHERVDVERAEGLVVGHGEVQAGHIAVVVLAVDQVVDLGRARVRVPPRKVHEAPDAVRLLAHVVVLALQLEQVPRREADGLRAGEAQAGAAQQLRDLPPELVRQLRLRLDPNRIEVGDGVAHGVDVGDGVSDGIRRSDGREGRADGSA